MFSHDNGAAGVLRSPAQVTTSFRHYFHRHTWHWSRLHLSGCLPVRRAFELPRWWAVFLHFRAEVGAKFPDR